MNIGSERVMAGVDAKGGQIAVHGWQETAGDYLAWARRFEELGAGSLLYTNVDVEGLQKGSTVRTGQEADRPGRISPSLLPAVCRPTIGCGRPAGCRGVRGGSGFSPLQREDYSERCTGGKSMRNVTVKRETKETSISITLNPDGSGKISADSGVPFFDHMLNAMARHGGFDLTCTAKGDLGVDCHHTIEDIGIVLGDALRGVIGDGHRTTALRPCDYPDGRVDRNRRA